MNVTKSSLKNTKKFMLKKHRIGVKHIKKQ